MEEDQRSPLPSGNMVMEAEPNNARVPPPPSQQFQSFDPQLEIQPTLEHLRVAERAENKIPQSNQPPAGNLHPPAVLQQPTQLSLPLPLPPWYRHPYCSSLPNNQLMPPPPQQPGYVIPPARPSNPSNSDLRQELQRQIRRLDELEKRCPPIDLPPGYRVPPLLKPPEYGQYRPAADNSGSSSFQNFTAADAAPPPMAGSSSTYGSGGSSNRQQVTARVTDIYIPVGDIPELLPSYVPALLPRPSHPPIPDLGPEFQRQIQQLEGLDKRGPPMDLPRLSPILKPPHGGQHRAGGANINYSAGSFPADPMGSSSTDGGGCCWQVPHPHGVSSSSSSSASGGGVVNTPPFNLPENQRILWEAQCAENARLWKTINGLQVMFAISRKEIAGCKRRLNSIQRLKSLRRLPWKPSLPPIQEEEE